MDDLRPVVQLLERLAEEVQDSATDEFDATRGGHGMHHAGNAVDRQLKIELIGAKDFLRPSTLRKLRRQSLVGRSQFARVADQRIQRAADSVRRLAARPQGRRGQHADQIVQTVTPPRHFVCGRFACLVLRHGARLPCVFALSSVSAQGSASP